MNIHAAVEALILVADEPVDEATLARLVDRPSQEVAAVLRELSAQYREHRRGFELRNVAGGWRLYTNPDYASLVEEFLGDERGAKLSQAALETLAIVAYQQPVSRSRVSAVRGVNCDGVMRTLMTRGLVEESGTDPETHASLYYTTPYFLEKLGLSSLDELPELAQYLPEADEVEVSTVANG